MEKVIIKNLQTNLTESGQYSQVSKELAILGTEASPLDIETVKTALAQPIRNIETTEQKRQLIAAIGSCARMFCGAKSDSTSLEVYNECGKLCFQRFGFLGVNELLAAFECAAANKTEVNMVAYGGIFTVSMFGDVLSSYTTYRNKIRNAISKAEEKAQQETKKQEEASEILKGERATIEAYFSVPIETERWDVPAYWFRTLKKYGLDIVPAEVKKEIWLAAQKQAVLETRVEKSTSNDSKKIKILNDVLIGLEKGKWGEPLELLAQKIYAQMLVCWLLAHQRHNQEKPIF
jgi:hypothetical protein